MKVRDLIALLSEFPRDMEVVVPCCLESDGYIPWEGEPHEVVYIPQPIHPALGETDPANFIMGGPRPAVLVGEE